MSLVGRENVYTCQKCTERVTTVDRDEGTTPMMIRCRATEGCDGMMMSAFYPEGPRPEWIPAPTFEWYKPSEHETSQLDEAMQEHVRLGGLLIRPIG